MKRKIDIIGCGKVGRHFFNHISSFKDLDCRLINSRNLEGWRGDAELSLIAVSDNAIPEIARKLTEAEGIVAHVSGSTPLSALEPLPRRGVFYPFQSFAEGVEVNFSEIPLMIEANTKEVAEELIKWTTAIGCRAIECGENQRRELHLAGVLTCNFTNELIAVAQQRLDNAGLPRDLLEPLIRKTIDKALKNGAAEVRTGPALRRDIGTILRHIEMLSDTPLVREIYERMTALIIESTGGATATIIDDHNEMGNHNEMENHKDVIE